jgi:hypothetical protein
MLVSIVAYIGGLIALVRVTPLLFSRSYDEGWFTGIAVIDIIGALLAFGAVVVTYSLFSGNFAIKVLDFVFLVVLLIITLRLSFTSFQLRLTDGTFRISRIIAGSYSAFLALASLYYIVQLFTGR